MSENFMVENFENMGTSLPLIGEAEQEKEGRRGQAPLWVRAIREDGKNQFRRQGLPDRRQEEWKYTDVSFLSQHPVAPPQPPVPALLRRIDLGRLLPHPVSALRLVFVNGFYSAQHSSRIRVPGGVEILSMAGALRGAHPWLGSRLGYRVHPEDNPFVALNNAFLEDGALVLIPEGVRLSEPIHLVFIGIGPDSSIHPRNLVVLEKGASATIVEEYVGIDQDGSAQDEIDRAGGVQYLCNPVTEVLVGEGADLDHYKIQRESPGAIHISTLEAVQGGSGRLTTNNVNVGARLARNEVHTDLTGAGASCTLNGLVMIGGSQHTDNHTLIRHSAPHCRSRELYHAIADGRSHVVFNGKIHVERGAAKTDSRQSSRALMLSNGAAVDTKPQLEIFADDVKCSHGAAIGHLDAESLFYLGSRGIDPDGARRMLTLGFARQVLDGFRCKPLRAIVEALMATRLKKSAPGEKEGGKDQ